MAAMKTAAARTLTRTIRESAPVTGRVDRDKGVIHGVKVVGRVSANTHGVSGVDGSEYTLDALRAAKSLYEGIAVNVDHPPRGKAGMERSARDRFAWLENIEVRESGTYGDLHFLDPADPLAVKILNAACLHPEAFALSHNALGRGEVRDRRYVITEIPEVHSVDIVADGGTNRSLFEGKAVKVKVCEVLKSRVLPALKAGRAKRLTALLESDPMGTATSPLMEDGEGDHRDSMYKAMRACEEAGDDESANKIHKLLGPPKKDADGNEVDEGPEDNASAGEGKADEEKKATEEGRKRVVRLAKGFLQLRESAQPPVTLVDALVKLPDEESRLALLESWPKGATAGPDRSAPRSSSPHTPLRESAAPAPKTAEEFAAALLR